MTGPLKIYKDSDGVGDSYAARNLHDVFDDCGKPSGDSSEIAFKLRLRQKRPKKAGPTSPEGSPNFAERRQKPQPTPSDWYFNDPKFGDCDPSILAELGDDVLHPVRFTPQASLNWMVQLRRDSSPSKWNEHHLRSSNSDSPGSAHHAKSDCASGGSCKPNEYACARFPGCEGSSLSQWAHLIKSGKNRNIIAWETTLRGSSDARIDEARVGMLGRKPLYFKPSKDSIVASDPKLKLLG